MPSTTITARISALEALARPTDILDPQDPLPVADWVVDDGPKTNGNSLIDASKTPTQHAFNTSATRELGRPVQGASTAPPAQTVIHLASTILVIDVLADEETADSLTVEAAHRYPPLTLDPERARNANGGPSAHVSSSSVSSFHSVSLSEDTEPSTPGSVSNYIATFPMDAGHTSPPTRLRTSDSDTTSLTESYEDRAAAQRRPPPPKLPERPGLARVASFKSTPPPSHPVSRAASASGSASIPNSPIIRPTVSSTPSSSTSASPYPPAPYVPRRSAPPPPSRSSDRASIQSATTTHSQSSSSHSHGSWANTTNNSVRASPSLLSLKTKRPTPIPSAVRRRYEALFVANVMQRRRAEHEKHRKLTEAAAEEEKPALLSPGEARGRRAVGWRGLSVDLITGDEMVGTSTPSPSSSPEKTKLQKDKDDANIDLIVGADERLEGALVRLIWQRSGLDKERLAEIWSECDLTGQGALNLDAFVKGMWRIDEELRRAQALAIRAATSGSGASRRAGQGRNNLNSLNFSSLDSLSPSSLHNSNQLPSPKGAQQRGVPPPPPPRPLQKTWDILR
ncbi:hypothetical protein BJ912DRAFT_1117126 [Pholiota molesta]|nr:hypothetical protein BJ912DRAFT_1117126 [Pholiota molesta]